MSFYLLVYSFVGVCLAARATGLGAQTFTMHSQTGPKELYFDGQFVDHFNYLDSRTWSQRFFLQGMFAITCIDIIIFMMCVCGS